MSAGNIRNFFKVFTANHFEYECITIQVAAYTPTKDTNVNTTKGIPETVYIVNQITHSEYVNHYLFDMALLLL